MTTLPTPERIIQKQCLDYLTRYAKGPLYVTRTNTFVGSFTRPDNSTGFIRSGEPGSPDAIMAISGKYIGLEFKTLKGRQSPAQQEAQRAIEATGNEYWLIRSVEELQAKLKTIEKRGD